MWVYESTAHVSLRACTQYIIDFQNYNLFRCNFKQRHSPLVRYTSVEPRSSVSLGNILTGAGICFMTWYLVRILFDEPNPWMLSKRLGQVSLSSTWFSSCNRWVASQKVSVVIHIHIHCRVLSQLFWLYMLHFILHDDIIFNLRSLQPYADLSIFTCRITLHIRDAGKERSRGEFISTAVGSVIFAHVLGQTNPHGWRPLIDGHKLFIGWWWQYHFINIYWHVPVSLTCVYPEETISNPSKAMPPVPCRRKSLLKVCLGPLKLQWEEVTCVFRLNVNSWM